MNSIQPWLWIGAYRDTLDAALLGRRGIRALLHLVEDVRHPGIQTLYLPVEDGQPLDVPALRRGLAFVDESQRQGQTLLIACGAGISRSATFAVAALREREGIGLLDAYRAVRSRRAQALPHPVLWASLCAYYAEEVPYRALVGASG
jgi:dual specificity MAP kinase phosphatase